ncbi:MAG: chemotaxis protein CheR, partial [Tepidanaerobacteraceae bacterium]|nr:chemotaxis protein CheR [Tepidanaerobacteraceae bacterium]
KMGVINSVYIIASDIDQKVIKQAQLGIYSIKGMANISNEMIKVNFKKEDNNYIINDRIKDKVDFKILNLLEDDFPLECDLILCRNVMIYFTEEAKEKLYKKFYNALSENGIFFVGSTEQIIMPQKYGFINRKNFFYQKNH